MGGSATYYNKINQLISLPPPLARHPHCAQLATHHSPTTTHRSLLTSAHSAQCSVLLAPRSPLILHHALLTFHCLLLPNGRVPGCVLTDLRLTTCYLLLATCYLLLAAGYWLLATCYWLLATCYLLLATRYLLLATCYLPITAQGSLNITQLKSKNQIHHVNYTPFSTS